MLVFCVPPVPPFHRFLMDELLNCETCGLFQKSAVLKTNQSSFQVEHKPCKVERVPPSKRKLIAVIFLSLLQLQSHHNTFNRDPVDFFGLCVRSASSFNQLIGPHVTERGRNRKAGVLHRVIEHSPDNERLAGLNGPVDLACRRRFPSHKPVDIGGHPIRNPFVGPSTG